MKNREIKFRALTKDGKWKYGFLGFNPIEGQFYIHEVEDIPPTYANPGGDIYSERYDVEPETIGQYTGLKDKNDNDIYEGDIVRIRTPYRSTQTHTGDNIPLGSYTEPLEPEIKEEIETVKFSNGSFNIGYYDEFCPKLLVDANRTYDLETAQAEFCGGFNEYRDRDNFVWNDIDDGDLQYLLDTYRLKSETELLKYLGLEVIGSIFENPELIKNH